MEENEIMHADLSVWGMYTQADPVVKAVMIGLLAISVLTWALFFIKGVQLLSYKSRLKNERRQLQSAQSLKEADSIAAGFPAHSPGRRLVKVAIEERQLSQGASHEGIKERTLFRLERGVAGISRVLGYGNGYLATVGAISPFIGLFGTVWGIMHSFIGIAKSQTTNLAVVAPGIAEALLATAIGLIAAIPAVVIYNLFTRGITAYKAQLGDLAAQMVLLQGRDLDLASGADTQKSQVS